MRSRFSRSWLILALSVSSVSWGQDAEPPKNGGDFSTNTQPATKVPTGVILVKGAWSSASDLATPLPEGGGVTNNVFSNQYFGMSYALPPDWTEKYKGPPPSESGRYVLAQISTASSYKGPARGSILVTAEDMFFTPQPVTNAVELINYSKNHLQADYRIEMPLTEINLAGRTFVFLAYWSPVAQLHWYVLATQIRCHAVEIVLSSRDTKLLESLLLSMNRMKLPKEASPTAKESEGDGPVCIKDYARDQNVIARVEPVFTEHKFNPVPVRIIIDRDGKVKHIHFLSAFPDQAKAITDALLQWKFRQYLRGGQPAEVETGVMFGRAVLPTTTAATSSTTQ
jgi:hypothetical protein